MTTNTLLSELDRVLDERKAAAPDSSYVASLYAQGLSKILEKVGEEATEAIIAAKDVEAASQASREQREQDFVKEVADMWFHSMVALKYLDLSSDHVLNELSARFGIGGLDEKASRSSS